MNTSGIHVDPAQHPPTAESSTFTGDVVLRTVRSADDQSALAIYEVTFDAGARTHWHTHPHGQALHIISGTARVQIGDEPASDHPAGSTVWIPADTRHWHGADPHRQMTHLAIQQVAANGNAITWCESVNDETYTSMTTGTDR